MACFQNITLLLTFSLFGKLNLTQKLLPEPGVANVSQIFDGDQNSNLLVSVSQLAR